MVTQVRTDLLFDEIGVPMVDILGSDSKAE